MISTRWRMRLEDQVGQAEARVATAESSLSRGDGGGALQSAYQGVVDAAMIRVWHDAPPWSTTLTPEEMRERVRQAFPNLFAALAGLDVTTALTSPWTVDAAAPYVQEARTFATEVAAELHEWLKED
jgi:hypothetical protein